MSEFKNSGVMNPNKYKRPGTKQPDYKGTAKTTCVHCQRETEFVLAAWVRGVYTTFLFKEKAQAEQERAAYARKKAGLPEEPAVTEGAAETTETGEQSPYGNVPF